MIYSSDLIQLSIVNTYSPSCDSS